jgi:hypothetical protein
MRNQLGIATLITRSVVVVVAAFATFAACGGDDGCPTGDNQYFGKCTDYVAAGTSCPRETEPPALPVSCYCDSGGYWECNSCPFGWVPRTGDALPQDGTTSAHDILAGPPSGSTSAQDIILAPPEAAPAEGCDPGQTCILNSWEHGCDCVCGQDRVFHCAPDTENSHCPGQTIDAGM